MPSREDLPPELLHQALNRIPKRTGIEGSLITRGLYQGMAPPTGPMLRQAGIDTIVLCAAEWQPPEVVDPVCSAVLGYQPGVHPYPGVSMVYAPADDDFVQPPSRESLLLALQAATLVAQRIREGGTVLVSCWAGKNRSGLVTGLALHRLTGLPGSSCVGLIKRARPQALTNPQFIAALGRIRGVPMQQPGVRPKT